MMDTSIFFVSFLMYILILCSSGSFLNTPNHLQHKQLINTPNKQLQTTTQHDFIESPITPFPTTPGTNPVTTPVFNPVTTPSTGATTAPPDFPTPPIVTVPSPDPTVPITFPPATTQNPVNPPVPVTNPVTTPSTTVPGGDPLTSPPALSGQSWCVVRSGASEMAIQTALDYACGIGGADCSAIQQDATCYNPNSLQNHASYAFNSYYQSNPGQTSCDFGGTAMITNVNPSSGSCIYPTSSSSSTSPTTASPFTTTPIPTPTTESSSGGTPTGLVTPPTVFNPTSPPLGGGGMTGYGIDPPFANASSTAMLNSLQPFISCIIVVTTIITGRTVLDI